MYNGKNDLHYSDGLTAGAALRDGAAPQASPDHPPASAATGAADSSPPHPPPPLLEGGAGIEAGAGAEPMFDEWCEGGAALKLLEGADGAGESRCWIGCGATGAGAGAGTDMAGAGPPQPSEDSG